VGIVYRGGIRGIIEGVVSKETEFKEAFGGKVLPSQKVEQVFLWGEIIPI